MQRESRKATSIMQEVRPGRMVAGIKIPISVTCWNCSQTNITAVAQVGSHITRLISTVDASC